MCIIKRVFYYEETRLPVIKYKDEIWVKANTVANILGYKNTIKSIQDRVEPEDKRRLSELGSKSKHNETLPLDSGLQSKHSESLPLDLGLQSNYNESLPLERNEKNAIYIMSLDYTV